MVKKSLEYFPAIMSFRGTIPSSSMIKAMWSIILHIHTLRGVVKALEGGERKWREVKGTEKKTRQNQIFKYNDHLSTLGEWKTAGKQSFTFFLENKTFTKRFFRKYLKR